MQLDDRPKERVDPVAAMWRGLRQPWLLLILGIIALLLVFSAMIFPQVPSRLAFDLPATTRWLISTSAEYGAIGQIMLNIGLFDVLHSLLLRILFGLIGLVLAIHLGDVIGVLLHLRKIPNHLKKETISVEEPVIASAPHTLYQRRYTSPLSTPQASSAAQDYLKASFASVEQSHVDMPQSLPIEPSDAENSSANGLSIDANSTVSQVRLLAQHSIWPNYLRPLLMIGLLTALIPVWLITSTGWELYPPPLAPGETISFDSQGLEVAYIAKLSESVAEAEQLEKDTSGTASSEQSQTADLIRELNFHVNGEEKKISLTPSSVPSDEVAADGTVDVHLNRVDIQAVTGPPGLLISTMDGISDLVLSGSSQLTSTVGLIFLGSGDEKGVLLPLQNRALRIVRSDVRTNENDSTSKVSYLVQLLDSNELPIGDLQQIDGTVSSTIEFEPAGLGIRFDPVPGIIVEAQYLPGAWLMLVALGLVTIGAIGYWLRTGYVMLLLAPWPTDRTIAVVQSDSRSEISALRQALQPPRANQGPKFNQ